MIDRGLECQALNGYIRPAQALTECKCHLRIHRALFGSSGKKIYSVFLLDCFVRDQKLSTVPNHGVVTYSD